MILLKDRIAGELKEGYELVNVQTHKTSTYYYITNPDGIKLIARTSDHDAIAPASRAHVQVICDALLHISFDFDPIYDNNDYEIDMTKEEAAKQLSSYYDVEISENIIYEVDNSCCSFDWTKMTAELIDIITARYIAEEITLVNSTILY
jgi:hypothetical protein